MKALVAIATLLFSSLVLLTPVHAESESSSTFAAEVLDLDPRFSDHVEMPVVVEVLATGLQWAEGPVWVSALDALLFSDVAADTIYRWDEENGLRSYLSPSGHEPDDGGRAWRGANGLALDGRGRLLLAQQSGRRVARMGRPIEQPEPAFEVLAKAYGGDRLNSPNDLTVSRRGDIYFTDPPYGLAGFENSPDIELGFFGVFRLSTDGELTPLMKGLAKPNGVALTVDQSRLLVSNSEEGRPAIYSLDLHAESPGTPSVFFDAGSLVDEGPGSTDGLAVHRSNSVFASVPNGLALLSETGELLGRLAIGQVTNAAFDDCYCMLYLTTPERLLRLPLKAAR